MVPGIIFAAFDDDTMYWRIVVATSEVALDRKHRNPIGTGTLAAGTAPNCASPAPEDEAMSGQPATGSATKPATMMQTAAAKWAEWKPIAIGVAIGLVAGPIVSGVAGFQTRTSTAEAATRAGIVEQQAMFCAERARGAMPAGAAVPEWEARNELARKWAIMPGVTTADTEVIYACAGKLAG